MFVYMFFFRVFEYYLMAMTMIMIPLEFCVLFSLRILYRFFTFYLLLHESEINSIY